MKLGWIYTWNCSKKHWKRTELENAMLECQDGNWFKNLFMTDWLISWVNTLKKYIYPNRWLSRKLLWSSKTPKKVPFPVSIDWEDVYLWYRRSLLNRLRKSTIRLYAANWFQKNRKDVTCEEEEQVIFLNDTRSIFKRSLTGLNSEFSFS